METVAPGADLTSHPRRSETAVHPDSVADRRWSMIDTAPGRCIAQGRKTHRRVVVIGGTGHIGTYRWVSSRSQAARPKRCSPKAPARTVSRRSSKGLRLTRVRAVRSAESSCTRAATSLAGPADAGRGPSAARLCFALTTPWSDGTSHLLLSLRWNCRRSWQLWSHRPGSIYCATTGSWPPVPGTASCPPSRLRHRRWRPRFERSALRPSPGVGGPARPGVCRRPQRLPGLWRSPADRGRPDRPRLDPDLSGGGRTAGGAPAEGPASVAVRVRRLTTSAIGCRRR